MAGEGFLPQHPTKVAVTAYVIVRIMVR